MMLRTCCWIRHFRFAPLLLAGAVGVAACDFEVVNPGRILEEDLNVEDAVNALVTGMAADFAEEYDDTAFLIARATDEMAGSGSYNETNFFRRGLIYADNVNPEWEGLQRGRWVAEDGLRRMRDDMEGYTFGGDVPTARAYLFAGLANVSIGEVFCYTTVSAGAPLGGVPEGEGALPPSEAFQRGLNFLAEAITHGTTAGAQFVVDAAHGARAQAYVGLGDWTNAVAEAQQVATDFVYEAIFSGNSDREYNEIWDETHRREEMSAYDTYAATFDPPDPRAPYTNCPATGDCEETGADGITPYWRQEKLDDRGSDIPVVKGTEMRLIEAEAALRNSDLATAITRMNEVRTFYGLADLTPAPASLDEGWIALDHERHLTLWLEARRLHDLRRWDAEDRSTLPGVRFLRGLVPLAGDDMDPSISKRAACVPISFSECLSNPSLRDSPACDIF
jgi:hypothetical protein